MNTFTTLRVLVVNCPARGTPLRYPVRRAGRGHHPLLLSIHGAAYPRSAGRGLGSKAENEGRHWETASETRNLTEDQPLLDSRANGMPVPTAAR